MRRIRILAGALVALLLGAAQAQGAWPGKPVRAILPFGPGGATDTIARHLRDVMEEQNLLPQSVVIQIVDGHFPVGARR